MYTKVPSTDLTDKKSYTDKNGNVWTVLPAVFSKAQADVVCGELNANAGSLDEADATQAQTAE